MKEYSNIFSDYANAVQAILDVCTGKQIIIYGYVGNGYFFKWLFSAYFNKEINYVIDDQSYIYDCNVYNPILLEYKDMVSCENSVILVAKDLPSDTRKLFESNGYIEDKSFFYISKFFYDIPSQYIDSSFYGWLEHCWGLNLLRSSTLYEPNSLKNNYSISSIRGLSNIISQFEGRSEFSLLDVGSGKGGAAICFALSGFKKVGCVEYDEEIYKVLLNNLSQLKMDDVVLYNCDACSLLSELDCFNVFYLNNPFKYDLMDVFLGNIIESQKRNMRRIYIIYSNPYCNRLLTEKYNLALFKRVTTDYPCRITNIYVIDEEL